MLTRIYFTCVSPLADEQLYQSLYAAASEERRRKTDRYRFLKDRMLSLGAEGLLRYALKKAGRGDNAISYRYGEHQKPYLSDADGFFFNLSHAGDYAMLAVSDAEVGCDIERIRPVDPGLFARVLTEHEHSVLTAAPKEEREALFFRYWVLKESCMKALGKGFFLEPGSFSLTLAPAIFASGAGISGPLAFADGAFSDYRYAVCRAGEDIQIQTEIVPIEELTGGI